MIKTKGYFLFKVIIHITKKNKFQEINFLQHSIIQRSRQETFKEAKQIYIKDFKIKLKRILPLEKIIDIEATELSYEEYILIRDGNILIDAV